MGSRGPNRPKEDLVSSTDLILDEHYFPDGRKRKRRRKYTGPLPKGIKRQVFWDTMLKPKIERPPPSVIQMEVFKREPQYIKREKSPPQHKRVLEDLKPRPVVTKLVRGDIKRLYGRSRVPPTSPRRHLTRFGQRSISLTDFRKASEQPLPVP